MASSHSPPLRRQTTVLVGGSNGTAGLCALLGDKSNPHNAGHVVRVVTRSPKRFVDASNNDMPLQWRCNEQKHPYDAFPFLPTKWVTHVGAPDSVFVYSDDDSSGSSAEVTEELELELDPFERAISGVGAHDDGGATDCIVLCCPVSAHLPILRRIARALYRLEGRNHLPSSGNRGGKLPPLVIGTLYGAGGFDWMSRVAFASEKTPTFTGRWKRDMILFGLKAFPFLIKSTQAGIVNLYGRWPVLACALSPSTAQARNRTRGVLGRALQCEETGKRIDFVGISSAADLGGDGSAEVLAQAAAAAATMALPPNTKAKVGPSASGSAIMTGAIAANRPTSKQKQSLVSFASSLADHADPYSSLGYLSCTLNATNTFLHPCIMAALFNDPPNPGQSDANGIITWDPTIEKTAAPRFYADGGGKPEAGRLITAYAAELYPLLYTLDCLLAPAGMAPISNCHGGDNTARMVFNATGNSPRDLAQRTGLTDMVLQNEFNSLTNEDTRATKPSSGSIIEGKDKLNYRQTFEFMCRKTLANNTRLAAVMTPVIKLDGNNNIRPNPKTRFFTDDVPHGLLIMLGLGELIGFDLERDMPEMLFVVRKLQRWMGKEYVLPEKSSSKQKLIGDAKDLAETAAPQAFGVKTITDLKQFLKLDPFGSDVQQDIERNLGSTPIQSKL